MMPPELQPGDECAVTLTSGKRFSGRFMGRTHRDGNPHVHFIIDHASADFLESDIETATRAVPGQCATCGQ